MVTKTLDCQALQDMVLVIMRMLMIMIKLINVDYDNLQDKIVPSIIASVACS